MKNKLLLVTSLFGVLLASAAAILFARQKPAQPPLFPPPANPYPTGIYAEGIIESSQPNGSNISLYPEVSGTVTKVLVNEGDVVHAGQTLVLLDDSVQRATAEQEAAQAQASQAILQELRASPRKEALDIAAAQVKAAQASLKMTTDTWLKQDRAFRSDARTVSKDALDSANNSRIVAAANLQVAERQYDLTKAGAWRYDILSQEKQYAALTKAAASAHALLTKYTLRAPENAIVLSINTAPGSYVSPQGSYDLYTQGALPVLVLGAPQERLHVRCYVDEILVSRLPPYSRIKAEMAVRGTTIRIPLRFVRIQPFVSPKVELSNQRQERVDVRVLPLIFSFDKPSNTNLYPGELVDVYVGN